MAHFFYWVAAIAAMPLSLSPQTFLAADASDLIPEGGFRAVFVVSLVVLGIILILISYPTMRLSDIGALVRKVQAPYLWLGALVGWLIVSTGFSNLAPFVPAIGSPERFDGTLIQAAWFSLVPISAALAAASVGRGYSLLPVLQISSGVTAIWAFLQGIGLDPVTLLSRAAVEVKVPGGAFGHGGLASMFIVVAVIVSLNSWLAARERRATTMALTLLLAIGAGSAGGRAAMIGLITSVALMAVIVRKDKVRLGIVVLHALVFAIGLALTVWFVPRAQSQAMRAVAAVQGKDPSFNSRIPAWTAGLRLMLANPWFGVGPGGFEFGLWDVATEEERLALIGSSVGGRYRGGSWKDGNYAISGNMILFSDDATGGPVLLRLRWDKAHNYLLDLALIAGIPAALFFIGFVVSALSSLWTSALAIPQGVGFAFLAFFVFGLVWFGTVFLDPVVWVIVGAGLGLSGAPRTPVESPLASRG